MSIGFHAHRGDWLLNPKILDQATTALYESKTIDRKHDVPYVAGYSKDGKTIYVDRELPKFLLYRGRKLDIVRYIVLHEEVEKALLEYIKGLPYQLAHQLAYHAEEDAVKADRLPWEVYDGWCKRQVRKIGARDLYSNCPKDLDLTPYTDERDVKTLRKMFSEGKPLWKSSSPA
ncbi:hypothetical protein [Dokdonella soli]|uniref:Uncharacterized protein n=1 Tax=Dokdonella soli TaxID=529810 RepID=A0ABN1IU44_9GAMM